MSRYRVNPSFFLWSVLCCLLSLPGLAQTTVTFDELTNPPLEGIGNPYINSGLRFELIAGTNAAAEVSVADGGAGGTRALDDTNPSIGGVVGWKISKADGSAFQLVSIWLQEGADGMASGSGTIKAYDENGSQQGSTVPLNFDSRTSGDKGFADNPDFWNVHEVRIEAEDIYLLIDNVTFGSPIAVGDDDPPVVTGINLVGTPFSTATSVAFTVNFSKPAKNVSTDDFQLTTAGTIGTIASVTGSGSTYTVTVSGLDGDGTIRLDVKAGTNIANEDDVTGTPAFTGGQLHYVGSCYTESFENKPDGATSFSSNGRTFTLGPGLDVESRTGFGAGPSNRYIKNNMTPGTFVLTADEAFTIGSVDLFLSDQTNGFLPTATGTLTIVGRLNGSDQFTITKNSGFPTTTTINNGFFTINFATEGGNYSNLNIDELQFTISGGFTELGIDNVNFCEAVPDVDNQPPVIQSLTLVGTPESTAGAVSFQAVFNEPALNVTLDDFSLHTTGTAAGTLTGIAGSGTTYTLQVTGIAGEGTIQVRLNNGTDIEDALANASPIEYVNGQVHYVGACYVETFEAFADGNTGFVSNGKNFSLAGNWEIQRQNGFGIYASDVFLLNTGTGPYTLQVADVPVAFSQLALYLSSHPGGGTPTSDGTLTIRGKSGGNTVYELTKTTGFPTDFGTANGFFFVDFAADGEDDYSGVYVDALEIELAGGFVYLALDNLGYCTDFEAPAGYTVVIDDDPITLDNEAAVRFTFAGAEVGTTYHYTFTSAGGGTPVTGSGTIATATDQVTGIDLSGLDAGTVTLSVTLTDGSGNTGVAAIGTVEKIVNNAPVITTGSGSTTFTELEDGSPVAVPVDAGLTVTDIDNGTLASATVAITAGLQSDEDELAFDNTGAAMGNIVGSYDGTTGVLTLTSAGATATLAQWQVALRSVTYSNSSPHPNTADRTITVVINDGLDDSNPATKTISVVAVNTPPVITAPTSIAIVEDITTALTGISFADVDAGSGMVTAIFSVPGGSLSATSGGNVTVGGTASVLTLTGSIANLNAFIAASNITYTTALNATGNVTLTVSIDDAGNTGTGGAQSATETVSLQVEAVNDAPVITAPASIAVDEDVATFLTGISFADVDAGSGMITVTLSVPSGALSATSGANVTVGGTASALTLTGTIADINAFIAASNVTYTTALSATSDVVLTVNINDSGNTGTGGAQEDTTTITLAVTAVNDAPVNTVPGGQTVDQNGILVFSAGNGNAISVSDVDAGGGTIRITLTATNGLITLGGTTGLAFISGSGAGDGTMTFEGTISDINTALNGLTFAPTSGYNGPASLQIVTNDLGLSGSGGSQTDTDVINITVNSISPVVTSVNTTEPDGTYKINDPIGLTVTFDQAVTVDETGGSPTLLLETGDTDRLAAYASGSGSNTLTFAYMVQAGDVSADLDYASTAALALNGATIRNSTDLDAVLTLPAVGGANSIAGQHTLVIDGIAPSVTSVDVPADGYYVEDDELEFMVNFSEYVIVNVTGGTPYLEVTIGTATVQAAYMSGSGSSALTFRYVVQAGDVDLDGIALGGSLVADGGTMRDAAGNAAALALNNPEPTGGVLVYAVYPSVTLSATASSPVNGAFTATVTFSEAVTGFTLGDIDATNATLSSLQTADNITYTFTVTPSADGGVTLQVSADVAVNIANVGNTASNTLNFIYDAIAPAVTSVDVPANGYYSTDDVLNFTVDFGEPVTVNTSGGTPYINMTIGSTTRRAAYTGGSGTNALAFQYTVQTGEEDMDGISVGSAITLDGGTIQDAATNNAALMLNGVGSTTNVLVHTAVPTVVLSSTASSLVNDEIIVTATFSEAMTDVTASDFTLGNATLSNLQNAANTVFTATVTPTADGVFDITFPFNGAFNVAGTGNVASNALSFTYDATAPAAPVDLTADAGDTEIALEWTANVEADIASYRVYGGAAADPAVLLETVAAAISTYTHTGLTNGTEYRYRVSAVDAAGNESPLSAEVTGVPMAGQTITFDALSDRTYGDEPITLTATASSGLEVTYSSSDASVASVSGDEVTIHAAGTVTITATQAGDAAFHEAIPVTQELTINPAVLTVTADAGQGKVYGSADPALTFTASGFALSDDESILTGALSRESGEDVDTYAIRVGDLSAGGNYTIAYASSDFAITPKPLTITANAGQGKVYGSADPALTFAATGFELTDDGTILTGTLSRESGEDAGDYAIMLGTLDAGNNYTIAYAAADFTITPLAVTVTAADRTKVFGQADPELAYTVAPALVTGDAFTGTLEREPGEAVGTYGIMQGTLALSDNYTFTFNDAELEITPSAALEVTLRDGSFVYDGRVKSLAIEGELPEGTSVSYANNGRTDVGSQMVTATIDGGNNYETLVLTATLEITPAERTLSFPALPDKTYGDADFSGGATASSGEAVSYTSSNPAVAEITAAGRIRITGAGGATITATVPDNGNYSNRPQASQTLTVNKAGQAITFNAPAEVNRDAGSIQLDVTASSGLPVNLTIDDEQVATLDGTTLNIHRLGTINITATQKGDGNHEAAEPVTVTVRVVDPSADFAVRIHPAVSPNGDGINEFLMIEGIRDYPENRVTVFSRNGTVVWEAEGYDNSQTVFRGTGAGGLNLAPGTYFYIVEVKTNGRWEHKKGYFVLRY